MTPARILVVEDDRVVARDIQQQLTRVGHTVVGVTAYGEEAVALAIELRPDLVLMDIRLEGAIDGIGAAQQIRDRVHLPVIYLTAYADDQTVSRASLTEPFGYLLKPFEDSQLRTTIEMALYKHAAERKLRESERRYAVTLSSIGDAVIATDDQACVTFMNPVAEALTGWPQADALGQPLTEVFRIVNEQTRATVEDPAAKVLRLGTVVGLANHTVLLARDGCEVPIDDCGSPIIDDLGRITGVVLVFRDMTQRRKAEEAEQAMAAAEAANRAKDEFLANVSHEIRTPMNAILGMTELVLDTPLRGDQRQSLTTVRSAADSLLAIIDDLLDFSKIEAGKLALDPAAFSLRAALDDTLRALAVQARQKGLELVCAVEPSVPDALIGDAGRLRQVLLNLVDNAIKFTAKGEVVVQVDLAPEPSPDSDISARFTVRDTGIGVPLDKQATIFQAFEQADTSTTRRYGGTGLGLTIAARLVAMMAGEISVESAPGQGSTFTFTARFGRQAHPGDAVKPVEPPAPALAPLRILVAEDNELSAQLVQQVLLKRGHRVHLTGDGREALNLVHDGAFDLLLLDLHMPQLDGFQVIHALRERERSRGGHLPVIALTARSRPEDRARCLAAGMDHFLTKPVQAADLWVAIERVIAASQSEARPPAGLIAARVLLAACGGDAVILAKICEALRLRLPADLAAVEEAYQGRSAPRLREAAHSLCGMVAAFSTVAGGLASDLEDHAASGQLDEAGPLIQRLRALAPDLIQQVGNLSLAMLQRAAEAEADR